MIMLLLIKISNINCYNMRRFVLLFATMIVLLACNGAKKVIVSDMVEDITTGAVVISAYANFTPYDNEVFAVYSTKPGFMEDYIEDFMNADFKAVKAAPKKDGSFFAELTGLQGNTTYYYSFYFVPVGKDGLPADDVFGEVFQFTTKGDTATSMTAVDLGLSVKWATSNIGAKLAEEPGIYYAWGEMDKSGKYNWETYKWCCGSEYTLNKYNTKGAFGTVDNIIQMEQEDDAAYVKLGRGWRIPKQNEWHELIAECEWTWATQNGIVGYSVKGPNSNTIFLPAAGMWNVDRVDYVGVVGNYWSSTLDVEEPNKAHHILFTSSEFHETSNGRQMGFSIRPVLAE